ncbi:type II toxin-antitoxin system RelE/ParE family toxin [Paenibacillus koleovorans]|uniref:type II toxin-antitoxin system RelE/ParE family toxin n=1 Tax=Paenibacillus koleovorans TaxID=121608 RepID=UPI000FDAAE64|nr:type II toxin-antitoxin system RelE/ParE family toxin [Paenibacillus koleovorans]
MATYKMRINPLAISNILAIKAYIAEDNPDAAIQVATAIYNKIEGLADFPEIGASLRAKINIKTDYRYLIYGSYLIFYKIEGEHVSVHRVLNGVQDYLAILFADDLPKN